MDEIATLDEIVVQEHRCRENLLDVESPLSVKKSVVKVTRRNFVSFQNAELRDLKSGRVEYLSVDSANDRVHVECAFDKLTAAGDFKTNLPHTRAGRFAVDMTGVRVNASAAFHRGGGGPAVGPAASRAVATRVVAEDRRDADAVADAVTKKYGDALARAVSAEVSGATHRGTVARLKAEMKKTAARVDAGPSSPFRVNRTADGVGVAMTGGVVVVVGGGGGGRADRPLVGRVSYARRRESYETRYDADLGALRWTGDLTVAYGGDRNASSPALQLTADRVRVRVVVSRSLVGHGCRGVEARVRADGLRYDLDRRFPGAAESHVRRRLSGLVERSLGAHVEHLLRRDVCRGRAV